MIPEHNIILTNLLKKHQKEHQDMYLRAKDGVVNIRVGANNGYKREVLRAEVITEVGFDKDLLFYDFKIIYFNNRITITDAYWAMSVLMDILLELTEELNRKYRRLNENI